MTVLGIERRASYMLDKHSTNWAKPPATHPPLNTFYCITDSWFLEYKLLTYYCSRMEQLATQMLQTSACQERWDKEERVICQGYTGGFLSLARERTRNQTSSINEIVMYWRVFSMLLVPLSLKAFRLKPCVGTNGKAWVEHLPLNSLRLSSVV